MTCFLVQGYGKKLVDVLNEELDLADPHAPSIFAKEFISHDFDNMRCRYYAAQEAKGL